jgi:hypothetical protein
MGGFFSLHFSLPPKKSGGKKDDFYGKKRGIKEL